MAVYYWEIHINIGYISNGMVYTHDTYIYINNHGLGDYPSLKYS